ncbi:MAG: type VI secretion system-associated protein TagF [Gammaproteobacteria bacterium]|nr:type VI secretion system-associated protein TagF [Gammaproteobacteria bacterium]MDH5652772.1 type VI secretion system-associated protein TagF [Gammaproteobacteria bacterium]
MNERIEVGVFGKLPAHGDFVQRNLSPVFIAGLDEWMQHYIAGSREQMGAEWLDIYLTSPIWRFAFSPGVIDENCWAGIMMPSVDRVGRYYPFSVVVKLPADSNPMEFITTQTGWYEKIEGLALDALGDELHIDEITEQLNQIELEIMSDYHNTGQVLNGNNFQVNMCYEEQLPVSVYPYLLDSILVKTFNSYSVWTTQGSERIEPCLFSVQGLPPVSGVSAMMDGLWTQWGWQQPYVVNEISYPEAIA